VTPRAYAHSIALICAVAAALCVPALSHASSGGGGLSGGSGAQGGSGGQGAQPQAQPGDQPVSASADGITVATDSSALLRGSLRFTGSAPQSDAGDTVEIQRFGHETGWTWAPTAEAEVQSDGSFAAVWDTDHIGRFDVRAVLTGSGAGASSDWPTVTVTVYRPAIATLFGPGFYGKRTACGEILRRDTIGVANRTLPCGTLVSLIYQGQTLVVPVIDRGPYANGADWDLTMATGRALGIDTTVSLGAVSLPQRDDATAASRRHAAAAGARR
jgi:rare lipoprotein A